MPSVTSLIGQFIEPPYKSFYTPVIAAGQYFGYLLPKSTAKGEIYVVSLLAKVEILNFILIVIVHPFSR